MSKNDLNRTSRFMPGRIGAGVPKDPGALVAPLLLGAVVASLVSVAASGILLGLGLVLWIADCLKRGRLVWESPPFKWFFLAFLLLSVMSAVFSEDPLRDIRHLKSFIKFMLPFLLAAYMTRGQVRKSLLWIFAVTGISMLWGFIQFFLSDGIDLLNRIDGFMSHWMTFSGQVMMVLVACAGYAIFLLESGKGKSRLLSLPWFILASLLAVILILTYTRSAWGGMLGGLAVLTALNLRARWVLIFGAVVVIGFCMMPSTVHDRLSSGFDPRDTTTRGRLDVWRSGIIVALEHPVKGVGFSSVAEESLKYRREKDLPDWAYQHSHNNLIQVAATSGIPALVAWMALWCKIVWDFLRIRARSRNDRFASAMATVGIAIMAAFHLMGLLEFNFGDSEVLTLFLYFLTIPYVLGAHSEARMEPGNWGRN